METRRAKRRFKAGTDLSCCQVRESGEMVKDLKHGHCLCCEWMSESLDLHTLVPAALFLTLTNWTQSFNFTCGYFYSISFQITWDMSAHFILLTPYLWTFLPENKIIFLLQRIKETDLLQPKIDILNELWNAFIYFTTILGVFKVRLWGHLLPSGWFCTADHNSRMTKIWFAAQSLHPD